MYLCVIWFELYSLICGLIDLKKIRFSLVNTLRKPSRFIPQFSWFIIMTSKCPVRGKKIILKRTCQKLKRKKVLRKIWVTVAIFVITSSFTKKSTLFFLLSFFFCIRRQLSSTNDQFDFRLIIFFLGRFRNLQSWKNKYTITHQKKCKIFTDIYLHFMIHEKKTRSKEKENINERSKKTWSNIYYHYYY